MKQGEKPETQNKEPDPPDPANMSKHTFVHLSHRVASGLPYPDGCWGRGNPNSTYSYTPYLTHLSRGCMTVHMVGYTTWTVGTHS